MLSWLKGSAETEATPVQGTEKPKVLIGVAGFHGVCPEVQENFFAFAYNCGRRCPDYDFLLKIAIKREQFRARNNLVDLAIGNGCDYLLMLDDDMVIPADLFERLMRHQKDVVGALYFQRGGAYHPVLMRCRSKKDGLRALEFIHHTDECLRRPGLHDFSDGVLGGGCILFKTDVFRKIPQPYFWIDGIVGTDVHICQQLSNAGVELWADTSFCLGHVGEPQIVTFNTIPQMNKQVGLVNGELWNEMMEYTQLDNFALESAVYQAAVGHTRREKWSVESRDTWESVKRYYQDFGWWHVFNLIGHNMKFDHARALAINKLQLIRKKGEHIVDMGAGIGYCAIPLAEQGFKVTAIDIEKTPTLDCLKWRVSKHKAPISIVEMTDPLPPDLPEPADGVLMISVFDHLWDPIGMLDWCDRNIKVGGFMICDTFRSIRDENEPQHIVRYDPHRMPLELRRRGWREAAEDEDLFIKER